jgi:hypothetical protein
MEDQKNLESTEVNEAEKDTPTGEGMENIDNRPEAKDTDVHLETEIIEICNPEKTVHSKDALTTDTTDATEPINVQVDTVNIPAEPTASEPKIEVDYGTEIDKFLLSTLGEPLGRLETVNTRHQQELTDHNKMFTVMGRAGDQLLKIHEENIEFKNKKKGPAPAKDSRKPGTAAITTRTSGKI